MKCSICDNKKLNYLFSAKDYITGDNFSIRKCSECGCVLTAPSPNPENLKKYYQKLYYGNRKLFIENIVNY
ncbi:MAG: hypothetical protein Q8N69_02850, partial [bacterium]|nr:hypothetical protein [bacterium]